MSFRQPSPAPWFSRVLVVRLSAMGDIVHTMAAVASLRAAFPHLRIGWLVEERWAELLCTLRYPRSAHRSQEKPLVDRIHTINTAEWRRAPVSFGTWLQMAAGFSELRGQSYEVAIDFQGAVRSAWLARSTGAQVVYGDAQPRENAASMFYTRQVLTNGTHVIEQALSLVRAVTQHATPCVPVEFPIDRDADHRIAALTSEMPRFAILNPGAGWGAKQWPPERYGVVAQQLARDGVRSVINYGPGEEELAEAVEAASDGGARRMCCSVSELVALTRRARLFIGGDTGPLHLAAALRVPVVGIFGPTNPARNGPFATSAIVLRSATSSTSHARHREPEKGLLEITPAEVILAARRLLALCGRQNSVPTNL